MVRQREGRPSQEGHRPDVAGVEGHALIWQAAPPCQRAQRGRLAWAALLSFCLHVSLLALWPAPARTLPRGLHVPLQVRLVQAPAPVPVALSPVEPASPRTSTVAPPSRPRSVLRPAMPQTDIQPTPPGAAASAEAPATSSREDPPVAPLSPGVSVSPEAPVSRPEPVTPPAWRAAYLANPAPAYPLAARRLGLEGEVLLRAEILPDGRCGELEIARSSGHALLDEAALAAVKRWRFLPARRGEEPVAARVEIPIRFRLTDSSADPRG